MKEKYLPIGTVVRLKNGTKRMMVIGFMASVGDGDSTIYDYIGCLYPEGFINVKNMLLFQHDQIEEIFNEPFSDEESKVFHEKLLNVSNEVSNEVSNDNKPVETLGDDVTGIL